MKFEAKSALEEKLITILAEKFSSKRYNHIMGVVEVSEKLAKREGASREKVRIAALLHDYAKNCPEEELTGIIKDCNWSVDQVELEIPELLHAPASACLAEHEFRVSDEDVLEAIRFHTIGNPGMGLLAKIIYVADYTEPFRNFPGLESVRKLSLRSLELAIIAICNNTIKYNIARGRVIHPNTLELRNSYLRRKL
ncbi:MAG TPA: bis(5'-nucleosyl)-tetraphosphatase (symmetrical) YqeK [Halanaerobiales bacterium]|nr:bis(5'-nucleosyl)-tetraphosphatase (symmetrical) YqeK [Halanaerobiales bacterium]